MISTLFPPDQGSIAINGKDTRSAVNDIKKIIGIVPQEISLYDDLSAIDNLLFFGSLYNVSPGELKRRADLVLKDFGLSDRKNDRIRTFSGGMKRRINIAAALMHDPQIVIMDEPTVGIDPQSRNNIYEAVQNLRKRGITILYTTHYMEEAERFSDRIGIIDNGKIIAEGTLDELLNSAETSSSVSIKVGSISEEQSRILQKKWKLGNEENTLFFSPANMRSDLPVILNDLFSEGLEILDIDIRKQGLESVFLHLTGKKLRD